MTNKSLIIVLLISASVLSCQKTGPAATTTHSIPTNATQQSVVGKWTITGAIVTLVNTNPKIPSTKKMISFPVKQWEFRSDGNLYIPNGSSLETIAYQVTNGNKLVLRYKGNEQSLDLHVQPTAITLSENKILSDGTISKEVIDLEKR